MIYRPEPSPCGFIRETNLIIHTTSCFSGKEQPNWLPILTFPTVGVCIVSVGDKAFCGKLCRISSLILFQMTSFSFPLTSLALSTKSIKQNPIKPFYCVSYN